MSLDYLSAAFEIYRDIKNLLSKRASTGIYQMLEYESELEILDPQGEVAVFSKRQRVKFLQDNVITFQDHAWGAGELLQDYQCSPGKVVDCYKDGDRWNILISLRETKSAGNIQDFQIQRKLLHSFREEEEWWQLQMYHETKRLVMSITFPKDRHCRNAKLSERNANRSQLLTENHFTLLSDGRQVLRWERMNPKRFETCTISWEW